jgi:multidrug efflux pump subunit AcrA (membrane-fusion protein)
LLSFCALLSFYAVFLTACTHPSPPVAQAAAPTPADAPSTNREVRISGTIQAVRSSKVLIPAIYGSTAGPVTLTHLIPNGASVKEGDLIAAFDPTQQMDAARDAQAKFDDLTHQVDQKRAQNNADAAKRDSDLKQAQADLAKAQIELKKGPLLSEIDRLKNEEKAGIAAAHVESLTKSNALHDKADGAALRILELQRDRQKVTLERTQNNINLLTIKASIAGMVAHQNVFRANTLGHPQEGDQLYRGQALLSIFDPTEMAVVCSVGEPDGIALARGTRATVRLDAYPDLVLPAHLEFASPVASSALGSPIKNFTAVFHLDKSDPHLLPDLSAAIVIAVGQASRQVPGPDATPAIPEPPAAIRQPAGAAPPGAAK